MIEPRTVREIADYVGGEVTGASDRVLSGFSTPEDAESTDLVYLASAQRAASVVNAGAALVPSDTVAPAGATVIKVSDPARAMARVIAWMLPMRRSFDTVSAAAHVEASADVGRDVGIGPFTYVGPRVRIGNGTEIHPLSTIGADVVIGQDCIVHSGVHIYPSTVIGNRVVLHCGVVIGADGFGYVPEARSSSDDTERYEHRKVPQVGIVIIEDDVEIGANTTIDRATLSATRIGRGTKIDNLVTVGHNSVVGRHCVIIGQAGLSGSTTLEDYVTVAGQAGLTGHIRVGAHAVIGAQSGVTKSVPRGGVVLGSPAVEAIRAKKALALIDSLPEFKRTLAGHERRLAELERGSR